ncbi:hypothetical protein BO78DRAFT_412761 [Aspergillus sclerotiicarbonarius CBS 121057]|uniref:SMP domain-containing protein n=1 Tax=Aspergillus sclerotiicarbonarius (strain CBS 121057 / IBT 28362) TaxID=1448318 RepID=A0A319EWR2_ASPSB|nr:hypothetical protein BO78DRAFT_412761 [Aspergillus sclerotiicarbonarius CBS 121057]
MSSGRPHHDMTKSDSERIQSSQAKSGGDMSSGGFASRAQAAGDRWAGQQSTGTGGGYNQPSGTGGTGSGSYQGSGSGSGHR